MRMAILSDTHFGDPLCALVDHESMTPGSHYRKFREAAGRNNDFLVLVGDILDFSITDYRTAHRAAAVFFRQIQQDNITRSIIYVPGNHDYDLWHTVEYQINIIHQIDKGKPARQFKWSVPGLIDLRSTQISPGFRLPGTIDEAVDPGTVPEVPLYLNNITINEDGSGRPTYFYFAYPNLYVADDSGTVVITHGHYLESYWSFAGEWILKIAEQDIDLGEAYDLWELVALNLPLCQLACSGIGQAGPLTALVQKIQREAKNREFARIDGYIDRLQAIVDDKLTYTLGKYDPREWGTDLVLKILNGEIKDAVKNRKSARACEEFLSDSEVLHRLGTFYDASCVELAILNNQYGFGIPNPDKIIIGHTHCPIGWLAPDAPETVMSTGVRLRMYNTGGWLWRAHEGGGREFCGAEIFIYDDNGFSSIAID